MCLVWKSSVWPNFIKISAFLEELCNFTPFRRQICLQLCPWWPIGGATSGGKNPTIPMFIFWSMCLLWKSSVWPNFIQIDAFFAELFHYTPFSEVPRGKLQAPGSRLGAPLMWNKLHNLPHFLYVMMSCHQTYILTKFHRYTPMLCSVMHRYPLGASQNCSKQVFFC